MDLNLYLDTDLDDSLDEIDLEGPSGKYKSCLKIKKFVFVYIIQPGVPLIHATSKLTLIGHIIGRANNDNLYLFLSNDLPTDF